MDISWFSLFSTPIWLTNYWYCKEMWEVDLSNWVIQRQNLDPRTLIYWATRNNNKVTLWQRSNKRARKTTTEELCNKNKTSNSKWRRQLSEWRLERVTYPGVPNRCFSDAFSCGVTLIWLFRQRRICNKYGQDKHRIVRKTSVLMQPTMIWRWNVCVALRNKVCQPHYTTILVMCSRRAAY